MQNTSVSEYNPGINIHHQINERHRAQELEKNVGQRSFVQPLIVDETKQYMDGLLPEDDSEDETMKDEKTIVAPTMAGEKKPGKKTRGRVKIKMEFIQNKLRRYTTFSKRKTGIMKKAYELSTLTGTQVMLLVASETGHVYTFATRKLQPMITSESGKALIQTCLNSPDPSPAAPASQSNIHQPAQITAISAPIVHPPPPTQVTLSGASQQRMSQAGYEEPDLQYSNSEDGLKVVQSTSSFPMTNYIAPTQHQASKTTATYAVQPGITTIFSPAGTSTNGASVHLQANQSGSQQQPQILSGQLQLHRIHPQNIILTGNSSGLQSNHIILNPTATGGSSIVMADNNERHEQAPPSTQQQQPDVITLVNSELSSTPLQMVYSPSNGVIYAPQSSTFKRSSQDSSSDVVSMQHTPVIQTALQQDSSGVVNRHLVEGAIIVRQNQGDMGK